MMDLSTKVKSRGYKGGASGVYLSKPLVRAWEQVHSRKLTSHDVELMFEEGRHIPLKAVRKVYRKGKRDLKWTEIRSRVRIEMPEDWVRKAKKTISYCYTDLNHRLEDIIAESLIADVPLRLVGEKRLRIVDNPQSTFNYLVECDSYDATTFVKEEGKTFRLHLKSSYQRPSKPKRKVGRTASKTISAEIQRTEAPSTQTQYSERVRRAMAMPGCQTMVTELESGTSYDRGFGE